MAAVAQVVDSFTTHLHPCGLENIRCNDQHLVVCGCYELDEEQQHRKGGVEVFTVEKGRMVKRNDIDTPSGVLDLRLTQDFIITALASESLHFYSTNLEQGHPLLHHVSKADEGLFLSLDYFCQPESNKLDSVVVSTQSSSIIRYQFTDCGLQETLHITNAHTMFSEPMPAWIVANDPYNEHILLSGGDDCKFRLWDIREGTTTPTLVNSKAHTAGVTSCQWHPTLSHILVTGSYDESFHIWDMRQMKTSLLHVETGIEISFSSSFSFFSFYLFLCCFIGGGVWRTKWYDPQQHGGVSIGKEHVLATANMQSGSNVYRFDEHFTTTTQSTHFVDESNNHLSYGITILGVNNHSSSHGNDNNDSNSNAVLDIVSCSFYDSIGHHWKVSL